MSGNGKINTAATRTKALADYLEGVPYKLILLKHQIGRTTLYNWINEAGLTKRQKSKFSYISRSY